jgi:RNA polymerase sigma-54 factor
MKQSLQLKISQQLTMTPQLQQAIRLLQLSTLDLQQEIQNMVDTNPMLEVPEAGEEAAEGEDYSSKTEDTQDGEPPLATTSNEDSNPAESEDFSDNIPTDLPVDSQWDDIYPSSAGSVGDADDFDFDGRNAATETLQDHLRWQLNLTPMSDTDRVIALALIDAVLPSGFLSLSVQDIFADVGETLEVELDEVIAVLHRLQQFDPVGAVTADLRECLLVQLDHLPKETLWRAEACHLVDKLLPELGARNFPLLMRRLRLNELQLGQVVTLIQSLDPRPGERIAPSDTTYVTPDVFVHKLEGRWIVELNPDIAPRIRINSNYASLIKRADDSADNSYLKNNLQEARWFLKSLQSRNETLMKVASRIVEHQQGFLEYGAEAMKPLVLSDIAEAIEMHESTVSRVTTNKYMHTPAGIFELKYFFSSHVGTDSGGECSSTAIRAIIKKTVAAESPRKPLSDSKIAQILIDQGVNVARRTIAKYRESLGIPPSNERKRLV